MPKTFFLLALRLRVYNNEFGSLTSAYSPGNLWCERISAIDFQLCLSSHAIQRCAERNITADEILYVVEHGRHHHNAGTLVFFLAERDIPLLDQKNQRIARLEGLTVQTKWLEDGTLLVITLYRNRNDGLKDHRRKTKFDRRKGAA